MSEGLSPEQIKIAGDLRGRHDFFEKMFSYGEYLLNFNFQTCPKGWIKRKDIKLTPDQVHAFTWIYNMVLLHQMRNDSAKVQKWIELSNSDKKDHCSSWRYCNTPYETFYPYNVYQALFVFFMWNVIFPEQMSRLASLDAIVNRLKALNYDSELILEDSSKNYGWLYARLFDSGAINILRYIFNRT